MNSIARSSESSSGGGRLDVVVGAGGAHVGELLRAHDVERDVVVVVGAADDHAFVDVDARTDEEAAALLEPDQRVGRSTVPVSLAHERADAAAGHVRPASGW